MLFQPSNISPSTFSGIDASTVDVLNGINVSWQVNGDTPMTDYQITIYQNDAGSTQKYTTGKITLATPFQTHDRYGNPQFFSTQISASALSSSGIVNGYANGYKMLIKQWWNANDYVEQASASVFFTRTTPTLNISSISFGSPCANINATYSQAEGDPISTVEWIFAVSGYESTPIEQTGAVTTQMLSFEAKGLMQGVTYSIECNVVTASGMYVSTGFETFTPFYNPTTEYISFVLGQARGTNGVYLSWEEMTGTGITQYEVYRKEEGVAYLKKIATVSNSTTEIVDYSIASNQKASYVVIGSNGTTSISIAESPSITPIFWEYSILLCYLGDDGGYHVSSEYIFGVGVETGSFSNNNDPTIQKNFTKYPNRQPISSQYKTGSLKGYIGQVSKFNQYVNDTVALQNAIFDISSSRLTKFLKTRKGEVLMVDTLSAINMQTFDASPLQPLTATINWVEVGSAQNLPIVSLPMDSYWPMTGDRSVYTVSFSINHTTGELMVKSSDNLYEKVTFSVDTSTGQLMTTEDNALFSELSFYIGSDNLSLEVRKK